MIQETIKIGAAGALSGTRTAQTPQFYYGVKLAVEHWNKNNNPKVEIVWGDDRAEKEIAPKVAKQLMSDGVQGVVGHFSSVCALKAAPIYMENNIPLILPAATNPDLTKWENVFRICATDNESSRLMARESIKNIKANKIAFINDGSYYGENHINSISKEVENIKDKNIDTLTLKWEEHKKNSIKTAELLKFEPDVILFSGRCHVAVEFINAIHYLFKHTPIIFGDDVIIKEFTDNVQGEIENAWAVGPSPTPINSNTIRFISEYESIVGAQPGFYAASTYAAVEVLLNSIKKKELAADSLIAIMHNNIFPTILGGISFDQNGELINKPIALWKLKNKQFVIIN